MTVRILEGDVRARLADVPEQSVQCCVTSPPYYGLRDYGVTGQIGLEPTLAEYIATMVAVFRDVRRVLRDDGTFWLNIGDSYAANGGVATSEDRNKYRSASLTGGSLPGAGRGRIDRGAGLKPKDLMMVPARLALALQDDGWYLRSDIIWHKPNPMPESVTDRPTSAHEHIFLLTKQPRYYYDADAIREANAREWDPTNNGAFTHQSGEYDGKILGRATMPHSGLGNAHPNPAGRNCRNVWSIATMPYKEAHFATFPPEIPRRCIMAGTSEKGQCAACGAPWVRVVEVLDRVATRPGNPMKNDAARKDAETRNHRYVTTKETTGWSPSCECNAGPPIPQTVLDPFAGAGTTLLVADQLGRNAIGVELNPTYADLIERRLKEDAPMFVSIETVAVAEQIALL